MAARTLALIAITALVVSPLLPTLTAAFVPGAPGSAGPGGPLAGLVATFRFTPALQWLGNSLLVSIATTVVAIAVGAPAAYALSRARGRFVAGYSLVLFVVQSLPVVVLVIPLFVLFAGAGLVDSLGGITLVYIGLSLAVAIWMLTATIDSVPVRLEESAWLDGCSVFGSFVRIVLPGSWPGIVSAAIYSFLLTWNDYIVALVFIKSNALYTLPIGLQSARTPGLILVIVLPPLVLFGVLHRFFNVGGIAGSLADR
ncbi:carbohydrate ABC transporter permease [Humibacter ginsenosidimutans]|uniref:Carbohydrate ABC transporter permease n=1 Tax=Humibacter ginsenosidimutans TaxID=2599293 RepID=A0A5B8M0J1_9MICO|nr:carbohydrate ABC transporter permease [Humibacter ginsenosidimutans]QDZ13766.1 carbohydrate ABC transporter permease [Humibacter ginsenosidimutans]